MNCDALQQLTALEALGALDGPDPAALRERLERDAFARAELGRFLNVAVAVAAAVPRKAAPPALRARVMDQIRRTPQRKAASDVAPPSTDATAGAPASADAMPAGGFLGGIRFVNHDAPWMVGPLPGTRFKVLSASPEQEYAMLLIELAAGALYPEHDHVGAEEMYVLTGDLQSEGRSLGPGDFLHAEPGSHHHELRSIEGCTAIMVVPAKSLVGMM